MEKESFWNGLTLAATVAALFLLFTSAIPLIQLGLIPPFKGKNPYINLMRISVAIDFVLLIFVYWTNPLVFNGLWVVRFTRRLLRAPLSLILVVLSLSYSVILAAACVLRHQRGLTGGDLAVFTQAVWTTTQGHFLYSSIKDGICLLGDHVSPVVAALAPLYKLWPDPSLLLILQAAATGSCVLFAGLVAKEKLRDHFLAVVFALMYFFYYYARLVLHEDFHPEVLVEPFMFLAFIFLERKNLWGFILSLLVIISGKENMPGITFMLGFYAFAFKRWKAVGAAVMAASIAIFLIEIKWIAPYFNFQGRSHDYAGYYMYSRFNFDPAAWFSRRSPLIYILEVCLPFLYLPFLSVSTLLLTFPILFQNAFSQYENMRSLGFHYTAGLNPFLMIASIYGFYTLTEKFSWIAKKKHLAASFLLFFMLMNSGPSEYFYLWNFSKVKPRSWIVRDELKKIGPEYSVLTQGPFLLDLINRKELYILDSKIPPTQPFIEKYRFDYVLLDRDEWKLDKPTFPEALEGLQNLGYAVEVEKQGIYILKRTIQAI